MCPHVPTVAVSPPCSAPAQAFSPGTLYVLLNARGGTAMDMSGADNKTIIGYPMHGGPNQQWDFIPSGIGYAIRCMRPATDGNALYLTVDADCGGVRDRTLIVAGTHPVAWNVQQTNEGIMCVGFGENLFQTLADWMTQNLVAELELCVRPVQLGRQDTRYEGMPTFGPLVFSQCTD